MQVSLWFVSFVDLLFQQIAPVYECDNAVGLHQCSVVRRAIMTSFLMPSAPTNIEWNIVIYSDGACQEVSECITAQSMTSIICLIKGLYSPNAAYRTPVDSCLCIQQSIVKSKSIAIYILS
jgi:hypothetical protein